MSEEFDRLRKQISKWKDERLIEILNVERKEYTDETLRIVQEELIARGLQNAIANTTEEVKILRDLIIQVKFDDVKSILAKTFHCDKSMLGEYERVYKQLLRMDLSQTSEIEIIVDKHFNEVTKTYTEWDVSGKEHGSKERFSIELYNWNDWLSFSVNLDQVNQIGKELYVAYCLMKMTTYGFDQEDIDRGYQEIISTPEGDGDYAEEDEDEVHPWIRYWARTIDIVLFMTLIRSILNISPALILKLIARVEIVMSVSVFLWVFVESILLSTWGTTPGKKLLSITVRDTEGNRLCFSRAFNRSASVWIFGMGCGIYIISIIANIISYRKLSDSGITRWDKNGKYCVRHGDISKFCIAIALIILIGLPILNYLDII